MTSSEYINSNAVKLSVVSPVYKAEHILDELVKSISKSLNLIDCFSGIIWLEIEISRLLDKEVRDIKTTLIQLNTKKLNIY
mgnify:CR=1 FL=1